MADLYDALHAQLYPKVRWRGTHWISDPHGWRFLPRAMLDIGRKLIPEWTDQDPIRYYHGVAKLPDKAEDALPSQLKYAHDLLTEHRSDLGVCPLDRMKKEEAHRVGEANAFDTSEFAVQSLRESVDLKLHSKLTANAVTRRRESREAYSAKAALSLGPGWGSASGRRREAQLEQWPVVEFSESEWCAARAVIDKLASAERRSVERFLTLCHLVGNALRDGVLVSGIRPYVGGEVAPLPKSMWNTEMFLEGAMGPLYYRFGCFALDANAPFSPAPPQRAPWLCIRCDTLERFISNVPGVGAVDEIADAHLREPTKTGGRPPKISLVIKVLGEAYPGGRPKGQSAKDLARVFEKHILNTNNERASVETVRRAVAKLWPQNPPQNPTQN